jgi:osmotically-inducible protein OsmY
MTQLVGCAPSTILAIPQSISDRRTTEVQIIDQKIFLGAWSPVHEITDSESQKSHFNIAVFNKAIIIVGQVPTEEVKKKVSDALLKINKVKTVHNKMIISKANSIKQRAKDTITTSNVKTRMFLELKNDLHPLHVKIMTENDVIYLMGIVNEKEADEAIRIAKSSKGVKLVVPLFELDQTVENKY